MEKLVLIPGLMLVGLAGGCMPKAPLEPVTGVSPYEILSGDAKSEKDGSLNGTFAFRFKSALGSNISAIVIELVAEFPSPQSEVTLKSHASQLNLTDAHQVTFKRNGVRVDATVTVANDLPIAIKTSRLNSLNVGGIALNVEIRNEVTGARMIAWPLEYPRMTGNAALFDTAEATHFAPGDSLPGGVANGTLQGLEATAIKLQRAQLK